MLCPKCAKENSPDALHCVHCGGSTAIALLEVVRGNVAEKVHSLAGRTYSLGRASQNDLPIPEPSVSKVHARIAYEDGRFRIEDQNSLHGIYLNAVRVERAELTPGAHIQLGNVTLKFTPLGGVGQTTGQVSPYPWVENEQLLLSLVQTLNSTLVLSQVLEQVLDGVMRITRAERGFLLLADGSDEAPRYPAVAGLVLRVGRSREGAVLQEAKGISTSVVRKAMASGETVATGNALADPSFSAATSVIAMDLRTIVCIPLRSPRTAPGDESSQPRGLGALYVDNHRTSAPFPADSLRAAEALARHAALAIENAQLFEREQRTIEELRIAQKQILQSGKLATIGQMAAGIAHELNTPLTYIMGNLEFLQSESLSDAQREMVASISIGADRIQNLAQSLLAFSRPSREELVPLDVNEVVERALDLCRYQVLKGGLRLEKELAPTLPRILGVSNQLEMALINLVVNAAHAMAARELRVLRVSSRAAGEHVEIAVSDTGTGIPEHLQPTIFEPFTTTKPEGQGTGLGLSTVLMVVERHRGRIDFETHAGLGTTFVVAIPVMR